MFVYLITNTVNGKCYVGQTTQTVEARWRKHCLLPGRCRALENAIRKYGARMFEVSVVATVQTQEELNRLERLTCEALNTYAPHGYNLREGGGAKGKMHEQTKQIIRDLALTPKRLANFAEIKSRPEVLEKIQAGRIKNASASGVNMLAGRTKEVEARRIEATKRVTQSAAYRAAQSVLQSKLQAQPETRAKRSASLTAHWAAMTDEERAARGEQMSEWLKGHKKTIDRSPEAKAKRSAIRKALWATPEHRAKMALRNADPELLKRRGDAIRAGWARRRAKQQ